MTDDKRKRILFVDDEPNILEGLRRMLRSMHHEWKMMFANNGQEALDIMAGEQFDVIVSDMHMPGMNGEELLNEISERHPETVRCILSGSNQVEEKIALHDANLVHQYISKPCDGETLKQILSRTFMLRNMLANDKFRTLITQMKPLPSLPSLYNEILKKLQSPDVSIKEIGEIISQDISMSAMIVQISNTALYGASHCTTNPVQAVTHLGLDTVRTLVVSANIFSQFEQSKLRDLSLNAVWDHSVAVGACARQIVRTENIDVKSGAYAFLAGLLHDIGKLVLATNFPEEYASALALAERKGIMSSKAEHEIFGSTHAEVGAYLLELWRLPAPVVDAVAYHHNLTERINKNFDVTIVLHVADAIEYEICHSKKKDGVVKEIAPQIDSAYLDKMGLNERIHAWREICEQKIFDK